MIKREKGAKIEGACSLDFCSLTILRPRKTQPWQRINRSALAQLPKEVFRNATEIVSVRRIFQPIIETSTPNLQRKIIKDFIEQGKSFFKELIKDSTSVIIFYNGQNIVIRTGSQVQTNELTYARFCAPLGEVNRRWINSRLNPILPGLSSKVRTNRPVPETLKYFLHHGIQFSWKFALDDEARENNRLIYLAILTLDMIFVNLKRIKSR